MNLEENNQFPYLILLMDWFHQDYDLHGDVPDIVRRIAYVYEPVEVWGIVGDIRRFLQWHTEHAEESFEATFKPQVIISAWGKTVPEWLRWVESILLDHAPGLPPGSQREDPPPTFD